MELVLFENGTENGQYRDHRWIPNRGIIDSGVVFDWDEPVIIPTAIFRHVEKVLTGTGDVEVIVEWNSADPSPRDERNQHSSQHQEIPGVQNHFRSQLQG